MVTPVHTDPTEAICAGPAEPALRPNEDAAVVEVVGACMNGEKQTEQ